MAWGDRALVFGVDEVLVTLAQVGGRATQAVAGALVAEGEQIMGKAKELCPVDTGALRASGHVSEPTETPAGAVIVLLGFGGPAASYAVYVHERLDVHHPNGQAKFLSTPAEAAAPGMSARIAARVREALTP